jgi:hypothetical protein
MLSLVALGGASTLGAMAWMPACGLTTATTTCAPAVVQSSDGGLAHLTSPLVKIAQLVGDLDLEYTPPVPTLNLTESRVGLLGTDRGSSFVHDGQLYFFFGDTVPSPAATSPSRPFNADAIAVADLALDDGGIDLTSLDGGLPLRFLTASDGNWLPVTLDGEPLGTLKLPLVGFSNGADVYAFFSAPHHDSAVLAVAHDDGSAASMASYASLDAGVTEKMLNVFPLQVATTDVPGLGVPWEGDTLLVWGRPSATTDDAGCSTGDPIYLAAAAFGAVDDTSQWLFFAGSTGGVTTWASGDENARPITAPDIAANCNGGFSITYLPGFDRWLLLERCDAAHQIRYRVAPAVVGPWSDERIFFDPVSDGGFGHYMHVEGSDDDFTPATVDPTGAIVWGPTQNAYPYAPFVVVPSVRFDATSNVVSFILLMSVWNPYSPMVMKATLVSADVTL